MLKSPLRALVKRIKIEKMYWEMVKSCEFNFFKVKILLISLSKINNNNNSLVKN